jgi:hypothetical protein
MDEDIQESISRPLIEFFRVYHACLADSIEDKHPKEQSDNGPESEVTPQKQKGAESNKTCCPISEKHNANPYLSSSTKGKSANHTLKMEISIKAPKIEKNWRKCNV